MRPEAAVVLVLLSTAGAPMPTPVEPLPSATALVIRVEGRATAEAADGRLVELRPGRVLPADWRLSVPAGSAVALVCSNDRRARLDGQAATLRGTRSEGSSKPSAAEAACAEGEPLLPGTYRALARGDRDLAVERARDVRLRILQVRTRGSEEDDPRIPILLAPRETSVTDPRPEVRWTRVAGAEEYVVRLVGPEGWTERLDAGEVPCRLEPLPPGEVEVCTASWPEGAPDLQPAASYFLTVGARTGIATPVREGEPRRLRLLPAGATGLEPSLEALRELGLPTAEEDLRTAALLAEHGLRSKAAEAIRRSLVQDPSARAYLLQGSLEVELLLPKAALRSFHEAARLADGEPGLASEAAEGARVARELLGDAPVAGTSGEAPSNARAEARALLESVRREMELYRFGEALRLADRALALIEGRGYPEEAMLLAYRGSLLAALQQPEAALVDVEPLRELLVQEVARRKPPEAPDLTPLVAVIPELVLSLTSGDWSSGFERLQELAGPYRDFLPESFFRLFELLSLVQEGRIAEAAEVCHRLLEAEDLSATGPLADLLGGLPDGLEPICTFVDLLAAMPDEGPADPAALSPLFDAAGAMLKADPGPLDDSLALRLEQVMRIPDAAYRREAWPTAQDLRPSIEALQGVIARGAPPGLRSGLDSLFGQTLLSAVMILRLGGDVAGSFELAEEARARELLDQVADAELAAGADGEAAARIASLRLRRDELETEIVDLLSSDPTSPPLVELQAEAVQARRELDAEIHRLALERPEDPRAAPLSWPEILAALPEDTTLVAFLTFAAPDEDDTLVWVVTRDEVRLGSLPVEAGELEGEVRLFLQTLRRQEPAADLAESLYHQLWAPLREHVRTRRVLLVPHGPLQELPFAALRDPETGRWLVEDATLLHAPSATLWARLAARPAGGAAPPLVLGDPEGNLPAAATEARAVAGLWGVRPLLGPEATEEALRSRAAGAPLVHVSAHGVASPEDPLFTRLRLAPSATGDPADPARDGRLELHEVMTGLDLSGTGLVVLPACHTGEGPRTRGDEVTSLARAFLLAGARSAVTTAWAVDDESTAALMVDFHRRLASGADAAEALRHAQETALADPGRAHPWHWAGVSLHGAGGPIAGATGAADAGPARSGPAW